jgi:hypothetical protein
VKKNENWILKFEFCFVSELLTSGWSSGNGLHCTLYERIEPKILVQCAPRSLLYHNSRSRRANNFAGRKNNKTTALYTHPFVHSDPLFLFLFLLRQQTFNKQWHIQNKQWNLQVSKWNDHTLKQRWGIDPANARRNIGTFIVIECISVVTRCPQLTSLIPQKNQFSTLNKITKRNETKRNKTKQNKTRHCHDITNLQITRRNMWQIIVVWSIVTYTTLNFRHENVNNLKRKLSIHYIQKDDEWCLFLFKTRKTITYISVRVFNVWHARVNSQEIPRTSFVFTSIDLSVSCTN